VEYYHQLAGVMVDSAIILENVEKTYKVLYKFMKEKGFDIFLNNLIFKFLMTLFTENTHPSIYLSVIDCLLLSNEIVLHKACLLYLSFIREDILKCKDLGEANNLFEFRLKEIDNNKFSYELIKSDFGLKLEIIQKQRQEKLPKIIENIKKRNQNSKKAKQIKTDNVCDLDWPLCLKALQEPNVQNIMKYKTIENILIEKSYFDLSHNVKKLNEALIESNEKELKKENNEKRKKTLIFGNLLIDRQIHNCGAYFSSREKILGNQSRRQSSLMMDIFEQSEKRKKDVDSNSSEFMEMIHNRSDQMSEIDRSVLIESIIDIPKNNEENEEDSDSNKIHEIKETPKKSGK
jgi:hypothetical protein